MVDKEIFYPSKKQRTNILEKENTKGFQQIHDDFVDAQGIPTDGTSGRLTLTDAVKKVQKVPRGLTDALVDILADRGITSDVEIAKFKKILDRET